MAISNPHLTHPDQEVAAASRSSRFLARLIDGLAGLAALPFLILGWRAMLLALLALLVWQTWLLLSLGQTLGKKLMGIYIMRSDGELPNAGWLFLREFAIPLAVALLRYGGGHDPSPIGQAIQGLLGLAWLIDNLMIFGPTRRCLHDLVAGTHVVRVD